MAARRILVEKSVLLIGKWDVKLLNEDVARVIDLESREKRGTKIRLQLTTGGLQIARGLFQASQPGDFIPISEILDVITGPHSPYNIQCFTRGTTSPYTVVVYECSSDYDSLEFADNYRRLRKTVGSDSHNVEVKSHDVNWTLTRPNSLLRQSVLVQKDHRSVANGGQGQYTVGTSPNSSTVTSNKRNDAVSVVVQNGASHSHHASVLANATNGHVPTEKAKHKVKREKSFKAIDSEGNSLKGPSPQKEMTMNTEMKSQKVEETFTHTNGVPPQASTAELEMSNAELRENLQKVNTELKNIKLILEKSTVVSAEDRGRPVLQQVGSVEKRSSSSHRHTAHPENGVHHSHRVRIPDRRSKMGSAVVRTQSHRNGEIRMSAPEFRGTGGYTIQRPVQIVHVSPGEAIHSHQYSHRTRTYSNGMDPRSPPPHGAEVQYSTNQNAASMTLPRSYKNGNSGSPMAKHSPRVTFDENAVEEASRRSSMRSASKTGSLFLRPTDTVLRPIEKVYSHGYYVQPHTVMVGPGVRHVSSSGHRRPSVDRENGREHADVRNTSFENGHTEHEGASRVQYML